jgi:hypothetical protein
MTGCVLRVVSVDRRFEMRSRFSIGLFSGAERELSDLVPAKCHAEWVNYTRLLQRSTGEAFIRCAQKLFCT